MTKISDCLVELAKTIGWKLVNDDKGFSTYEFEIEENKHEHISHVIRILEEPNELEVYEIITSLIKVLPHKLKKKLKRIINKVQIQELPNVLEVLTFAVTEYKTSTDYSKLYNYGKLLGVDIEEKGFEFEYKLKKNKKAKIKSIIEVNLPIEIAPVVGAIKNIDYKIVFLKNNKMSNPDNE